MKLKSLYCVYAGMDKIEATRFCYPVEEKTMKRHKRWWNWAVTVAGLALMLQARPGVVAQDAQVAPDSQGSQDAQNADDQDPPSRVARLNYMEGSVSFQPSGENDWLTTVLNRPLVTGDNLWADEDSRAEV